MDVLKIGEFLKSLRKAKGLTQQQVAEDLYVSPKTISKWETGECLPDITIISSVAEFYEVSVDEILKGEKENQKTVTDQTKIFNQKNKEKLVARQIIAKYNNYFISSLITFGVFYIIGVILFFCSNQLLALILQGIGFIIGIACICLGNQVIVSYDEEEDEQVLKQGIDRAKKFVKDKNIFVYDIFSIIFLITFTLVYLYLRILMNPLVLIFEVLSILGIFVFLYTMFRQYLYNKDYSKFLKSQRKFYLLCGIALILLAFQFHLKVEENYEHIYSTEHFVFLPNLGYLFYFHSLYFARLIGITFILIAIIGFIISVKKTKKVLSWIFLLIGIIGNLIIVLDFDYNDLYDSWKFFDLRPTPCFIVFCLIGIIMLIISAILKEKQKEIN